MASPEDCTFYVEIPLLWLSLVALLEEEPQEGLQQVLQQVFQKQREDCRLSLNKTSDNASKVPRSKNTYRGGAKIVWLS